jgi:hypothetical protein
LRSCLKPRTNGRKSRGDITISRWPPTASRCFKPSVFSLQASTCISPSAFHLFCNLPFAICPCGEVAEENKKAFTIFYLLFAICRCRASPLRGLRGILYGAMLAP